MGLRKPLRETGSKALREVRRLRHGAHHCLGRPGPDGHHRAPSLLRLGVGQVGGQLALPYGDPILGQSAEIGVVFRRSCGTAIGPGTGAAFRLRF